MAIDPRNYDLDELRAASGASPLDEAGWSDGDGGENGDGDAGHDGETGPDRPAADAAFAESLTRDLAAMDGRNEALERPYLPALPASLVAEALIFEWLEFLVLQTDRDSVDDAVAYYESIGWLGADAAAALDAYLSGIDGSRTNTDSDLDADDHRVSLHYVARLASLAGR
jgi:archaellum component FlaD/FlaE